MKFPSLWHSVIMFAIALTWTFPEDVAGQIRQWNHGGIGGDWSDSGNWLENAAPGLFDNVFIGNLPVAEGKTVFLDPAAGAAVNSVAITNDATLALIFNSLGVNQDVLVAGDNGGQVPSRLFISNSQQLTVGRNLNVLDGGRIELDDGFLNLAGLFHLGVGSELRGGGTVNLNRTGGIAMRNNGNIRASNLTINQQDDGLIDLDGTTENGLITIGSFSNSDAFRINGTALSDDFNGTVNLLGGSSFTMDLSEGWTLGAGGQINLSGNAAAIDAGRIAGGNFTLEGGLAALTSFSGSGSQRVEANTTITDSADVLIQSNNVLRFAGETTVNGGLFEVEQDGQLEFEGLTQMSGGTFNTFNGLPSEGSVRFEGETHFGGNLAINGIARQLGDAHVQSASVINAEVFDLDGNGSTTWDVDHHLTLNAARIDSTTNTFNGTINLNGGIFSRLTVNLSNPEESWTMGGEMNLNNNLPFNANRIVGSEMHVTGNLNINDSNVRVAADTILGSSSITAFAAPDTRVIFGGTTQIESGAGFLGQGTLVSDSIGFLTLADGASLGDTDLITLGSFQIGDSPGASSVDNFEMAASSRWNLEIGGNTAGIEFDVLNVGGNAQLDGQVFVELLDTGLTSFSPEVGDEFTILNAMGVVTGEFDFDPVSLSGEWEYQWEFLYAPQEVTLRLASINAVPEPGGGACLLCGLLFVTRRRKRRT